MKLPVPSPEEFEKDVCAKCQLRFGHLCAGACSDDPEEHVECAAYREQYPYSENTTICGEDGCDGCFIRYAADLSLCKEHANWIAQNLHNLEKEKVKNMSEKTKEEESEW